MHSPSTLRVRPLKILFSTNTVSITNCVIIRTDINAMVYVGSNVPTWNANNMQFPPTVSRHLYIISCTVYTIVQDAILQGQHHCTDPNTPTHKPSRHVRAFGAVLKFNITYPYCIMHWRLCHIPASAQIAYSTCNSFPHHAGTTDPSGACAQHADGEIQCKLRLLPA